MESHSHPACWPRFSQKRRENVSRQMFVDRVELFYRFTLKCSCVYIVRTQTLLVLSWQWPMPHVLVLVGRNSLKLLNKKRRLNRNEKPRWLLWSVLRCSTKSGRTDSSKGYHKSGEQQQIKLCPANVLQVVVFLLRFSKSKEFEVSSFKL